MSCAEQGEKYVAHGNRHLGLELAGVRLQYHDKAHALSETTRKFATPLRKRSWRVGSAVVLLLLAGNCRHGSIRTHLVCLYL